MKTKIICPRCNQRLVIDYPFKQEQLACTGCGHNIILPKSVEDAPKQQVRSANRRQVFCSKCGQGNPENNFKCVRCGFALHGPQQPQFVATNDGTLGGLIPYKNSWSLLAYYFGIFSLIPGLGLPLGIVALIMGIIGVRYAKQHPEAKGMIHSLVGIIVGGLCLLANILILVLLISSVVKHR